MAYINALNYHFYENILISFKNNKLSTSKEVENERIKEKLLIQKNVILFNSRQKEDESIKSLNVQLNYLSYTIGAFDEFLLNLS